MSEEKIVEIPQEEQEREAVEVETSKEKPEVIEVEAPEGEAESATEEASERHGETKKRAGDHLKDAIKQVESFGQALGEALQGRANVVMVRVNDESLEHLDMLVDAEITSSRSESAAFLISEGIKANQALFDKISAITEQIVELREQLRREVNLQQPQTEGPEEEEASEDDDEENES